MKGILLTLLTSSILFSSCATLGKLGLKPSHLETVLALKNILDSSTFKAIKTLKTMNSNGVASGLPKEVNTVLRTLKTLGYGDEIDQITKSIVAASGVVLSESEGIIGDAIGELKFTDAVAVVLGGENAATNILKRAMYSTVKKRYSTRLENELGATGALKFWPLAAGAFNMFSKDKVDNSLPDFLAERAVDGLFIAIGKQESNIRTDYRSMGDRVVTKVFDYYTKKNKN